MFDFDKAITEGQNERVFIRTRDNRELFGKLSSYDSETHKVGFLIEHSWLPLNLKETDIVDFATTVPTDEEQFTFGS